MQERLDKALDEKNLYFNNRGMFSDSFLSTGMERSSEKIIVRNWQTLEADEFAKAFESISDLYEEIKHVLPSFNEDQMEDEWIKKVFDILGWHYLGQEAITKFGKLQKPDFALFSNRSDKLASASLTDSAFFEKALAVADAKQLGVSLDGVAQDNSNPSYQIIQYLTHTGKNWGILTDGQYWRLYSSKIRTRQRAFYEIDLFAVLEGAKNYRDRFRYFYNFFRSAAFLQDANSGLCFLDSVFQDGESYSVEVETELKGRAFEVVEKIGQGFLHEKNDISEKILEDTYENSLYFLFRLMFVLNCEAKSLLNLSRSGDYFPHSLRNLIISLKDQKQKGLKWSSQPTTYNQVMGVFRLLSKGDKALKVNGFGDEAFFGTCWNFLKSNEIPDFIMNDVLLSLACEFDRKEKAWQFIDFERLSMDHLGSIFEGLLEFKLGTEKKKIVLLNTSGERKATGSYYTPDYMVDFIVEKTLKPLVEDKTYEQILELKIIDPAMGSGHFLLGALNFLEAAALESASERKTKIKLHGLNLRKEILHACIFGVDKNPIATDLARFTLWIATANAGEGLEPLADQLIAANSLMDEKMWKRDLGADLGTFDAVVGNPPYLSEKGQKDTFREIASGWIGKKYYRGKMDLLYFFYHLGLHLLKKDGKLGFITTSYWPTADGGDVLRKHLASSSQLEELWFLGGMKVFKDAPGQHNLVTFLSAGDGSKKYQMDVRVFPSKLTDKSWEGSKLFFDQEKSRAKLSKSRKVSSSVLREEIWPLEQGVESKSKNGVSASSYQFAGTTLKALVNINEGLHTGADKVTDKHIEKYRKFDGQKGDGILVLSSSEAASVCKTKAEKDLLKPFVKNSYVQRWQVSSPKEEYFVLYIDGSVDINEYPNVKKHLSKYREILEMKRGFQKGSHEWYELHWPRTTELFDKAKIMVPYRAPSNRFAIDRSGFAGSADIFFLQPKDDCKIDIDFLVAWLNSDVAEEWCMGNLKKKGEIREYKPTILGNLPVPSWSDSDRKASDLYQKICRQSKSLQQKPSKDKEEEMQMLISQFASHVGTKKKAA